jgi:two-component system response regulator HydG
LGLWDARIKAGDGGTVFLDEIGSMSFELQEKLLDAILFGELRQTREGKAEKVDVRFIMATDKDLEKEVKEGRFREDLYRRISPVTVNVPPLRERKEDIPALASFFIKKTNRKINKKVKSIAPSAMDAILGYGWPGNVRELQNAMERAVMLSKGGELALKDLPSNMSREAMFPEGFPLNLERIKKIAVQKAMEKTKGNKTKAAEELGITRKTLLQKLREYLV